MKRIDLIRVIEATGLFFVRHGGNHGWSSNPLTGMSQPVPRHREINERLARRIILKLGNPAADLDRDDA